MSICLSARVLFRETLLALHHDSNLEGGGGIPVGRVILKFGAREIPYITHFLRKVCLFLLCTPNYFETLVLLFSKFNHFQFK